MTHGVFENAMTHGVYGFLWFMGFLMSVLAYGVMTFMAKLLVFVARVIVMLWLN
jgi:hypothetical protein